MSTRILGSRNAVWETTSTLRPSIAVAGPNRMDRRQGVFESKTSGFIEIASEILQSAVHRDRGDRVPTPDLPRQLQGGDNVQSG